MLPTIEHIGFGREGDHLTLHGSEAEARWYFSPPPGRPSGDMHAGVWHHIAFGAGDQAELAAVREHAAAGPIPYTRIFDHYFFDSCYTMTPGGRVELCTSGPGFELDEQLKDLGDRLCLSPRVEPLRAKLEAELPQIVNPRPRSGDGERPLAPTVAAGSAETGDHHINDETLVAAADEPRG